MAVSKEEEIMLNSAIQVITRNLEAVLPTTMKYALVVIFEEDDPRTWWSNGITTSEVAYELRLAADISCPTVVKEPPVKGKK